MKKGPIGHVDCPLCKKEAQVKEDKNGHPYLFCKDCTAQMLTHGGERGRLLRDVMRPVTVTVTVTEPEALPAAPAAVVLAAPMKAPQPVKEAKRSWLQPIMAGGAKNA